MSAIGDCVLTIPLADVLKQKFPDCQITWVVDCAAWKILEPHWSIDKVIRLKKKFATKPSRLLGLRKQLRSEEFDLVLDPQGLLKSSLLGWLTGATRRIGFSPPQARERSWWLQTETVATTASHLVDKHLQLLGPIDVELESPEPWLHSSQEDIASVDRMLRDANLIDKRIVLLNVGAGWASKRWPPERFGKLAKELRENHGVAPAVLWAGDDEKNMATIVENQSKNAATILPSTSLTELIELSKRADAMVSADSGPMHIAAASGLPCVGLFGPTDPGHCGPYGSQHIVLQNTAPMTKSKDRRGSDNSAMKLISVDEVVSATQTILDRSS